MTTRLANHKEDANKRENGRASASCQVSVIRKAFGEMKLKWSELKGVKLSVLSKIPI